MSIPLRHYADDHVRTVVAVTAALRMPELPYGGEGRPGADRPGGAGQRRQPLGTTAPDRQERTP